jgi:lycopene cyclase domain-containing protein
VDRFQYLIVLGLCLLVTLPLELVIGARVYRRPRRLALALTPAFVLFVAWDLWASSSGTWGFADRYTIGWRLPGDMAVEELAFFLVIPVCTLLTLEAVRTILARVARAGQAGDDGGSSRMRPTAPVRAKD